MIAVGAAQAPLRVSWPARTTCSNDPRPAGRTVYIATEARFRFSTGRQLYFLPASCGPIKPLRWKFYPDAGGWTGGLRVDVVLRSMKTTWWAQQRSRFFPAGSEGAVVGGLLAYIFFLTAASTIGRTAADTLFLSQFEARQLSWMYLPQAAALVLAGFFIQKAMTRVRIDRLIRGFIPVAVLLVFASWVGVTQGRVWLLPVIYVGYDSVSFLMLMCFWQLASSAIDQRRAKKTVPLIGSGGIAGSILAGFGVRGFAPVIGAENLILVYGALLVGALAAALFVIRRGPNPAEAYVVGAPAAGKPVPERERAGLFQKVPHLRYMALLVGALTVSLTLIDFQFKAISREALQREALASFMGSFHAYSGLLALFVQLFVAGRVVGRVGVMTALMIFPLTLFTGSLGLLLFPSLVLAVIAKGSDKVVGDTIYSSANQLVFFPVAPELRPLAKGFLDIIRNSAKGVAAIALIALGALLEIREFSYLVMILLGVGMLAALRIKKDYVRMLLLTLRTREVDEEDQEIDLLDAAGRKVLVEALKNRNPHQVLYALHVLDQVEGFALEKHLPGLLRHESVEVVVEALRRTARRVPPELKADLPPLIGATVDRRIREQALVALAAYGEEADMDLIAARLEDEDVRVRAAAIAGLIRYYGIEGMFRAIGTFNQLLKSAVEAERKAVAGLFGWIGLPSFYKPLIPLLDDPSPAVRRNALRSAGLLKVPALVPHIVPHLARSTTRQDAIDALAAYDEAVILPLLEPRLTGESRSLHVPKVLVRIGSQAAVDLLLKHYQAGTLSMRHKLLEALTALRRAGRSIPPAVVERLALGELELYGEFGARAAFLRDAQSEDERELREAVGHLRMTFMRQVFGLLGLIHDPATMETVFAGWQEQDRRKQANASEVVDQMLAGELRLTLARRMLEDPFGGGGASPDTPLEAKKWMYRHGDIGLRRLLAGEVEAEERKEHAAERRRRLRLLRTVPLFRDVPGKDLWPLVDAMEEVAVAAGETLFHEGESGDCLYLISAGRMGVWRGGRCLATKGVGDCFGETAVLSGRPRTASAVAAEDVALLRLKSEDFYEVLFDRTELALVMIRLLSRRLRGQIDLQLQDGEPGGPGLHPEPGRVAVAAGSQTPFLRAGTDGGVMSQLILRRVLVLQKIKLFSQLSQDALVRLAHRVEEVQYEAGGSVCRSGEHGDAMYGIIEGRVRVHRGEAELALLGEGQYFGEMAIIDSGPRTADCTAVEPAVLLRLHRDEAFAVCFQQINVLKGMIAVLGDRLRTMETWEERPKPPAGE